MRERVRCGSGGAFVGHGEPLRQSFCPSFDDHDRCLDLCHASTVDSAAGDGDPVFEGDGLAGATVKAEVVAHERGPKLRVFKFKPKRGYKRTKGHRQELTRIRITEISHGS